MVQLDKKASVYDPKKLEFPTDLKVEVKKDSEEKIKSNGKESLPKIQIFANVAGKQLHVLDIRVKVEGGSYVRNYIEKGKDLHQFQSKNL